MYGGGAHPNWGEYFETKLIDSISGNHDSIIYPEELYYYKENYTTKLHCCSSDLYDLIADSLQKLAFEGKFVDGLSMDENDSTISYDGYIINRTSIHDRLERINGEPHWIVSGDAPACYAESGDYAFTTEIDMGILDSIYSKKGKYEISSSDNRYGIELSNNLLIIYNDKGVKVLEFVIGGNFSAVISEEWNIASKISNWRKILAN